MPSVDDMELNNHVAIGLAESVDVNAAWLTPFRPQSHKNPAGKAAAHQQRDKKRDWHLLYGEWQNLLANTVTCSALQDPRKELLMKL